MTSEEMPLVGVGLDAATAAEGTRVAASSATRKRSLLDTVASKWLAQVILDVNSISLLVECP